MSAATHPQTASTSPVETTPLVLSYSGVLYALAGKHTTLEALDNALFYMGCQPTAVLNRDTFEHYIGHAEELSYEERTELHDKLQKLIKRAYDEGRVLWRTGAQSTWDELNELLQENSLPPINPTCHYYSYPEVKIAIEAQQLPYTVAHHC